MPNLDKFSIHRLYQTYGIPHRLPIFRTDGSSPGVEAPLHAIVPVWLGVDCKELSLEDASVQLCDFGESFQPEHEKRTSTHVPLVLRPPEVNFDDRSISYPADIWTLACILYEILGERSLFEGFNPDEDDVLAENISALGELPTPWFNAWKARNDFFTEDGKWRQASKRIHDPRSRSLAERIYCMGREGNDGFSPVERSDLLDMLSRMLVFNPEQRITAEELTKIKWMQHWGLPAVDNVLA